MVSITPSSLINRQTNTRSTKMGSINYIFRKTAKDGDWFSHVDWRKRDVVIKSLVNDLFPLAQATTSTVYVLFTFGNNPSGQLGQGNLKRCHSPMLMPIDFNGLSQEDLQFTSPDTNTSELQIVAAESSAGSFGGSFPLRIAKYLLFFLSIGLNVYLIRRFSLSKSRRN